MGDRVDAAHRRLDGLGIADVADDRLDVVVEGGGANVEDHRSMAGGPQAVDHV